jgi:predicted ribosome quality control (RQC) complex YloA/Tae2 family protein
MEIEYDLRKSVPENAKIHYEKSKKLKRKIPGMERAIKETRKKLMNLKVKDEEKPKIKKKRERRWFEKFRWFTSTDGFLVIGGRDATSNEVLIKKHLESHDLVFHANVQGAPFFVVKNDKDAAIPNPTRIQAATAAASYSKAWSSGMGSCDVYEAKPDQVSKSPPAGEYLPKGAFMVYGEKTWHKNMELGVAVGMMGDRIIGGPVESISSQTRDYVRVGVGDEKQSSLAKKIKEKIGGDLDDIQRYLPGGGGRLL